MNQIMSKMRDMSTCEHTPFMRVLFGQSSPMAFCLATKNTSSGASEIDFMDTTLNQSQRDAVRFALEAGEVALIHGPPGVSIPMVSKFYVFNLT